MITKGIIKSIDFKTNTCIVRIPLYEANTNEEEILIKATFSIQPGVYNGYKEDDVVYIDFEQDLIDSPIILGKLFLGGAKEAADPRSAGNYKLKCFRKCYITIGHKIKIYWWYFYSCSCW